MSKVLVTGSNGFVGQHLITELLQNNIGVVGVGGQVSAAAQTMTPTDYMVLDLSKADQADRIDFTGIDGVIHLAGLTSVGLSFDQPMQYVDINMGIEVNLFEAALAQKAKPKFVIISSGTLYDPAAAQPLTETSPVLPNSPYAVSKLGQEQMAQYYASRGFECLIARPFNHIGPGQGTGFIVPDLAQQVVAVDAGEQSEIMVGNLDAQRDYTDVRDIVRAYRLLLDKGRSGEIYNLCSGKPLSGHEILDGLCQAAQVKPKVVEDPAKMRPSDTPVLYGDHQKISQDTGWQPEIPLETTLDDVIADWRSRA